MRFLVLILLGYLFFRIIKGFLGIGRQFERRDDGGAIDEMVQDPQCKMYIPLRDARREVIKGREFYFCSKECAQEFKKGVKT
ncbi:MAG: YHS domain-containing protein [Desulfatiglans sp.]|jgi:YHS domain-containing protein|nr:YHS domain-containing protein [Desulfatiglans sp.]